VTYRIAAKHVLHGGKAAAGISSFIAATWSGHMEASKFGHFPTMIRYLANFNRHPVIRQVSDDAGF
jgi:hypothetical protein